MTAGPYKSDQGQWELLQSIVGYMPECSSERETAPHSCLVTMASESVMAEHEVFWSLREWQSSLILDLGCMKSVAGTQVGQSAHPSTQEFGSHERVREFSFWGWA